jgi:rare lipoprotein A
MPSVKYILNIALLASCLFCLSSCARKITESGKASYYADKFEGRRTASGETFHQNAMTAAHRTLLFGTKVKVINLANGRSVKVRINDRGPYAQGRLIDLSKKAARKLGIISTGVAPVEIQYKKKKK